MAADLRKQAVLAALRARLAADLESAIERQLQAHAAAIHEEARPENDKDTQATEASYVARGLAQRVDDLQMAVGQLATLQLQRFGEGDAIALSALVATEDQHGAAATYFLAPAGGGLKLPIGDDEISVVTPGSPLGRALLGKLVGDEALLRTGQGGRTLTVIAIA